MSRVMIGQPFRTTSASQARRTIAIASLVVGLCLAAAGLRGEPISVRHPEGVLHGFMVLRTAGGSVLAHGDLLQAVNGGKVTTEAVFHFGDGSLHDETVVFSQSGRFRLIRARLVQKGPAFPRSIDMSIDGASGQVSVLSVDGGGSEERFHERLALPADLANGMIPILLKNVTADAPPKALSLVVATPKPRLVRLAIASAGRRQVSTGGGRREATDFVIKVEPGGVSGWLASLLGKLPPDSHVWILTGRAPAFVLSEQPLYVGGPLWRIELASPTYAR